MQICGGKIGKESQYHDRLFQRKVLNRLKEKKIWERREKERNRQTEEKVHKVMREWIQWRRKSTK